MDNVAENNTGLLPEIWSLIAGDLSHSDIAHFKQTCELFNKVDPSIVVLQPIYAYQEKEITYLTTHHADLFEKLAPELNTFLFNAPIILSALEKRNAILDKINRDIIVGVIRETMRKNPASTSLDVQYKKITRIPSAMFDDKDYADYWKNLTHLNCANNFLTTLKVKALKSLQHLGCIDNKLTALDVQGLKALKEVGFEGNSVTSLNLEDTPGLEFVYCDDTLLNNVRLKGTSERIKNNLSELEEFLLFQQLASANLTNIEENSALIERLGERYNTQNCEKYLGYLGPDFTNNLTSQFSTCLLFSTPPSNETNNSLEENNNNNNNNNNINSNTTRKWRNGLKTRYRQ